MIRTFKYRAYPNQEQVEILNKYFGAVRFVYNWGLESKTAAHQQEFQTVSCFELMSKLPALKATYPWLKDISAQVLQSSLRCLDNAYTGFFREKKGFPKFKSKHNSKQSFQCPQKCSVNWTNQTLSIPKIKNIPIKLHRKFEGKIKTVTISRTATGKYFASILVDDGKELPEKPTPRITEALGIDVGLFKFLTASDGTVIENPRLLRKAEKRLKYEQYCFSKKKKGSANRAKQKQRVALLHERVANQRKDFLHKTTAKLVGENQATTFCVEDLSVKNMMKNHCLAKSIADASWGMFFGFLKYKCDWAGKNLLDIGRFEPSSKMCSVCGSVNQALKLSDRNWTCSCGAAHDRDINAATNIKQMAFQKQNLIRCIGLE